MMYSSRHSVIKLHSMALFFILCLPFVYYIDRRGKGKSFWTPILKKASPRNLPFITINQRQTIPSAQNISLGQQVVCDEECQWEALQSSRRNFLSNQCKSLGETPITEEWVRNNRRKLIRILVSDEHQALYCSIPKVACTNWKLALLILNGEMQLEQAWNEVRDEPIDNIAVHDKFPMTKWSLARMSLKDIMYRLNNYKSFVMVRHPFTRTLSVFKNKFHRTSNNPDYEFVKREYGSKIHSKYGTKSMKNNVSSPEYSLNFEEFAKYLGDPTVNFTPKDFAWGFPVHWIPMHELCIPCQVRYDYIGKLETFSTDTRFILDRIKAPNLWKIVKGHAAHTTNSSNSQAVHEHFSLLTQDAIEGLQRRYERDFQLFGYDKDL